MKKQWAIRKITASNEVKQIAILELHSVADRIVKELNRYNIEGARFDLSENIPI